MALRGDMTTFSLAQAAGKNVVADSVPFLDTPVCATQTRRFNPEAASVGDEVKALVISMDLPFAQKRFCATEGIATLSDHRDAAFGTAYGLPIKELRLLGRAVHVIDDRRILRYQQLVPEVGQEPNCEEAFGAIKALR